ncbi:MAG: hypothetical protein ACTSU5_03650 [Promethearchaeota archaeon]
MTLDLSKLYPEYTEPRLRLSFLVPTLVTLGTTAFKQGFWMALLITALEVFLFCVFSMLFVEGFLAVNRTKRGVKWKRTLFGTNLASISLGFSGVLIPITRMERDICFPSGASVDAFREASANLGYQALLVMPTVWAACAIVTFLFLLALSIHVTHGVEFLKALVFAVPVGILAFTTGSVVAGAPFIVGY